MQAGGNTQCWGNVALQLKKKRKGTWKTQRPRMKAILPPAPTVRKSAQDGGSPGLCSRGSGFDQRNHWAQQPDGTQALDCSEASEARAEAYVAAL